MRLRSAFVLLLLLSLGLPAAAPAPAAGQQKLLIGLIPEMNIFEQKARFKLLGEYLSKQTGVAVQFTLLSRYGNILDSFATEKMDGAFFGSFTGALAIQKLGVVPVARPVNLDGTSTYQGYLFVRKDSGIKDADGMKGKRMAYVEKATTAGYVFPIAWLREHGITDINSFFSESFFTGSHDAAIMAVLERKMDVGAAKHSMYDRVKRKDPRVEQELAIIATSPPVPSNGLCVRKGLDPALQQKLKQALLGLERDPNGKVVLEKFGALRFIETTAKDYQPVLDMARKAGIDLKRYNYLNE